MKLRPLLDRYGAVLIAAVGLAIAYFHMTHSNIAGFGPLPAREVWEIDSPAHLEYIARLVRAQRVPAPDACWECHQPPLYYVLAAFPYSIARTRHLMPETAVRLLSLCCYGGFLWFGLRLLAMEIPSRLAYFIGVCLLVFWPLGIVKAAMISNDIPLYAAEAAALYYTMRWRRDAAPTSIALAILWNGVAIAIKYTGIIIAPFIGFVVLRECCKNRLLWKQLVSRPVLACGCVGVILAGSTFGRTYYYYRIANHSSSPLLVPTVPSLVHSMPVRNDRLAYFIRPHLDRYLSSPFLETECSALEQRYFINYLLKTSLFGFVTWRPVKTAYALEVCLLGMLTFMSCSTVILLIRDKTILAETLPLAMFSGIQISALVAYRLVYPHCGNQDFRFIYPVTIAMTALYGKLLSWQHLHASRFFVWLGAFSALAFVCASISFILLNR